MKRTNTFDVTTFPEGEGTAERRVRESEAI